MVKLKKYEDLQAVTADWKIAFHSYKDQDDTWPATVKDIHHSQNKKRMSKRLIVGISIPVASSYN